MLSEPSLCFECFYREYVAACRDLGVPPLNAEELAPLLAAIIQPESATLH
jgi:hypothetical protein